MSTPGDSGTEGRVQSIVYLYSVVPKSWTCKSTDTEPNNCRLHIVLPNRPVHRSDRRKKRERKEKRRGERQEGGKERERERKREKQPIYILVPVQGPFLTTLTLVVSKSSSTASAKASYRAVSRSFISLSELIAKALPPF